MDADAGPTPHADPPVIIRGFRKEDTRAVRRLYTDGLTGGKIADNDTGLDMDDVQGAYMSNPGSHFWVAQSKEKPGEIVGMIGVQQHEEGTGEIRRLRVAQEQRRKGIGSALVEQALRFCEQHNYLKITLDTYMEQEPAIKLFEKFRFHHLRTRNVGGKDLMYFYLDLYGQEKKK